MTQQTNIKTDEFRKRRNARFQAMDDLIAKVQDAIFNEPEPATGIGGWHRINGKMMASNQRPDGTATNRKDKTTICYRPNGALYLTYNGTRFHSCYMWQFLRERYHVSREDFKGLLQILTRIYGICFDWDSWDANHPASKKRCLSTKTISNRNVNKAQTSISNDESTVAVVPKGILKDTIHRDKDNLANYLKSVFTPSAIDAVFDKYNVGSFADGRTVFWKKDQQGRLRNGKIMRYALDGHRDKVTPNSILNVPTMLKKKKKIPEDQKFEDVLFGEHLLADHRDKPVGLVESEKTALVLTAAMPGFVWIATGGATQNIERARTLLAGCNVTVFPDADAEEQWRKYFASEPGWKFDNICSRVAKERGNGWEKCDLADIIISERRK